MKLTQTLSTLWSNWSLAVLLVLCIVLGGTSQELVSLKLPIYIVSILVIAVTLSIKPEKNLLSFSSVPLLIGGAFMLVYALYLIPMPPFLWSNLPGRAMIVEGYTTANMALPWLPLSMTPEITFFGILNFLPLIAILVLLNSYADTDAVTHALKALLVIAVLCVIFGLAQMLGNSEDLYVYRVTNMGSPVGFFSNVNHTACFLAMALPISLYFASKESGRRDIAGPDAVKTLSVVCGLFLILGILLAESIAGYLLLVIALLTSFAVLGIGKTNKKITFAIVGIILAIILLDFFILGNQFGEIIEEFTQYQTISRPTIFANTWEAHKEVGLLGSGPGSFHSIYLAYESRSTIGKTFIPHAHNDYLQTLLEFGAFGYILIVAIIVWIGFQVKSHILARKSSKTLQGIMFVGILVPLVHSLVDYPLRTIAVASVLTLYIGIISLKESRT